MTDLKRMQFITVTLLHPLQHDIESLRCVQMSTLAPGVFFRWRETPSRHNPWGPTSQRKHVKTNLCGWKCIKYYHVHANKHAQGEGGQTKEVGVRVLEGKFQFAHETRNSPVGLTSPKARKREERYVYSEMKRATNKRLHVVKMSGLGVGFPRGKLQLDWRRAVRRPFQFV